MSDDERANIADLIVIDAAIDKLAESFGLVPRFWRGLPEYVEARNALLNHYSASRAHSGDT